MAKRFIVFALIFMLVCGALFVSCKQDPVKDSKAIGHWKATLYLEVEEEYFEDCEVSFTIKADKTFSGEIAEVGITHLSDFSGTWDADSTTTGTITVTTVEDDYWKNALHVGEASKFYADDKNLIIYDEDDPEASNFSRVEPN